MANIMSNLLVFQVVLELIQATIGAGLCFGALKWRRGLLTTVSIGWGAIWGLLIGLILADFSEMALLVCILIGIILMPILTYCISGVNRFMIGFLVGSKLLFMLTTVLAKAGSMEIVTAVVVPLVLGTVIGLFLMAWTQMRISALLISCTFIGASQIAPVVSEWINRIFYGVTGNISYLVDPIDLLFALFKIELTDTWMLISMIVLMIIGIRIQFKRLRNQGIASDTPLIVFETSGENNGKVYR